MENPPKRKTRAIFLTNQLAVIGELSNTGDVEYEAWSVVIVTKDVGDRRMYRIAAARKDYL